MYAPTCAEIYDELLQSFADLSCDVCALEALYRCRMALPASLPRAPRWRRSCAAPAIFSSSTPATPSPPAATCSTASRRTPA